MSELNTGSVRLASGITKAIDHKPHALAVIIEKKIPCIDKQILKPFFFANMKKLVINKTTIGITKSNLPENGIVHHLSNA